MRRSVSACCASFVVLESLWSLITCYNSQPGESIIVIEIIIHFANKIAIILVIRSITISSNTTIIIIIIIVMFLLVLLLYFVIIIFFLIFINCLSINRGSFLHYIP